MIKRIKRKYAFVVMSSVVLVLGLIITAINITNYSSIKSLIDVKLEMLIENDGKIPKVSFGRNPDEELDADTDLNNGTDAEEEEPTNPDDSSVNDEDPEESAGSSDDEGAESDDTIPPATDDMENEENQPETPSPDDEEGKDSSNDKKDEVDPYKDWSPETPYELRYFVVKLDTHGGFLHVDTENIEAVNDTKAVRYAERIFEEGKKHGFVDSYRYMVGETTDGNLIYVFLDATRELKSYKLFLISSLVITALGILAVFALVILFSGTALKPIIESYEKQKRFITDAGHEMKTPLTVISANAEIIELESGESQWISGIKNQVSKLASLTEKLVILSKMEEGAKLEMNEFSLSEALFDTCDQYRSIAISGDVRFDLAISENVRLVGNENEIRRCISLLLDNAFRYTNKGGFVSIKMQNLVSGAEIKITNSTDGVEKGSLDNWFDRFYRRDLSRNSDTGGSGIGLSVVKAVVLAHGGTVRASSTDGINVEFTINI